MALPALAPADLVPALAGVAMLGLAAWLLVLRPAGRLHRALALFLVVRGVLNLHLPFVNPDPPAALAVATIPYFDLATLFAGLHLGLVYRERFGRARLPGAAPWLILAGAAATMGWYALDHDAYGTLDDPGPLILATPLRFLTYVLLALLFAADMRRAPSAPRTTALLLAAVGFAMNPLYAGVVPPLIVLWTRLGWEGSWLDLSEPAIVAGSVVFSACALLGVGLVAWLFLGRGPAPDARRRAGSLLAVPFLGGVLEGMAPGLPAWAAPTFLGVLLDGVTTLALPLLLAYAILRHRLFDMDVKIRWTIRQGTVAAAFVAVFFVASESAQHVFELGSGKAWVGIGAAGLLVFALAPLQQVAERVAVAAMPGARPMASLPRGERAQVYLEQARLMWADGRLDRRERALLANLRDRLGLTRDEAGRLEDEATAGSG